MASRFRGQVDRRISPCSQETMSSGITSTFRGVGSCRRDLLDHVIILNERHLKRADVLLPALLPRRPNSFRTGEDSPVGRVAAPVSPSGIDHLVAATRGTAPPLRGGSVSHLWPRTAIVSVRLVEVVRVFTPTLPVEQAESFPRLRNSLDDLMLNTAGPAYGCRRRGRKETALSYGEAQLAISALGSNSAIASAAGGSPTFAPDCPRLQLSDSRKPIHPYNPAVSSAGPIRASILFFSTSGTQKLNATARSRPLSRLWAIVPVPSKSP